MKQKENVWISPEDLGRDQDLIKASQQEFYNLPVLNQLADEQVMEEDSAGTGRRDFLKYLGFSLGAATLAACETPVRKALPYVVKPDSIVPGVATYYASSFVRGGDFCPVIVKTREGRPIKIEGNTMSPLTEGGTSARAQASVLDLYDVGRLRGPQRSGDGAVENEGWEALDKEISASISGGTLRILTHTNMSPSEHHAMELLAAKAGDSKVVTYDPISATGILQANQETFGVAAIPAYRFDLADIVVNFGADFLGTWVSPVEYANQFAKRRKIKGIDGSQMSRLVQFESNMSYTGSNADHRVLIKPSEQGLAIAKLHHAIVGGGSASGTLSNPKAEDAIRTLAAELKAAAGRSLVLSGSNNKAEQLLINAINQNLGNYGNTLSMENPSRQRQGADAAVLELLEEMRGGSVKTLLICGDANPVYDLPEGAAFLEAMSQVSLTVALTEMPSETQAACKITLPTPHFLESWGDVNPKGGHYAIVQPTIEPLFNTRPLLESLLIWAGQPATAYDFIQQHWRTALFPNQSRYATFQAFWDSTLHDGYADVSQAVAAPTLSAGGSSSITTPANSELEISFYEPMGVGNGAYANNPWLQEMPDPVTRTVWDNVLHIPLKWDGRSDFEYFQNLNKDGDLVDVTLGESQKQLPVVRQFGQMQGTLATALGYGRTHSGKAGTGVGANFYASLSRDAGGNLVYFHTSPSVSKRVGHDDQFASVQHHHTLGITGKDETEDGKVINVDEKALMTLGTGSQGILTKRSIFRHSNADHLAESAEHLKHEREHHQHLNEQTLYPDRSDFYGMGHHWGMSVDLSACIGCGSCQVACTAENNVPIVGKKEVSRHHEMTWMRIDRYYYGDAETPNVVYQPMMCQHCDNAPCENVCPVAATNHSSEGLNQMAYNRCVGTRYCANNCPYKVRRFNWLDYNAADLFPANENDPFDETTPYYADNLTRMVLNPDVTVRSRGVIEKCSMCVQRIQEGKLRAKAERRELADGDIKTACQTACPTGAIVFGDNNDPNSEVSKLQRDVKNYIALEETNVRSSIGYLMKVTNKSADINPTEA